MAWTLTHRREHHTLATPLTTAHGTMTTRTVIVVALHDADGRLYGRGEVAPLEAFGSPTLEELAARLDTLATAPIADATAPIADATVDAEAVPEIAFALRTARGDFTLGPGDGPMTTAALLDVDAAPDTCAALREAGFTTFKLKLDPRRDPANLRAAIGRVRAHLGDDAELRLDANEGLTREQADDWLRWGAEHAVAFLEQPLRRNASDDLRRLGEVWGDRVALDESVCTAAQFAAWQARDWPGRYVLKPPLFGDPTPLKSLPATVRDRVIISSALEGPVGYAATVYWAFHYGARGAAHGLGTRLLFAGHTIGDALARSPLRIRYFPTPKESWTRLAAHHGTTATAFREPVVVADSNPRAAIGTTLDALAAGAHVLLLDPKAAPAWREERAQQWQRAQPSLPFAPSLAFATSGTSGPPKLVVHTAGSLAAAAQAFNTFFALPEATTHYSVLPPHHVGGWMPLMRAGTRGRLALHDWKQLEAGDRPRVRGPAVISLVPTQLQRLVTNPDAVRWLRTFDAIFMGGAALRTSLVTHARQLGLPLAPVYGMTETGAAIAGATPTDFVANVLGYRPFAYVDVAVKGDNGQTLPPDTPGRIALEAPSLFSGYIDSDATFHPRPEPFPAGDRGYLTDEGRIVVAGRMDRVINTGGEKVSPEVVEALLRDQPGVDDAFVFGLPDDEWGERVVAAMATRDRDLRTTDLVDRLREQLPPYALPRAWARVEELPRNALGKIDRQALHALLLGRGAC